MYRHFYFCDRRKIKCASTFLFCDAAITKLVTCDDEIGTPMERDSTQNRTRKWSNLTRNGVRSASQGGRIALFSPSQGGETEPGNPSFGGQEPKNGRFWGPGARKRGSDGEMPTFDRFRPPLAKTVFWGGQNVILGSGPFFGGLGHLFREKGAKNVTFR